MKITKYGHSALYVNIDDVRFMIDPGGFSDLPETYEHIDALVITHEHGDHYQLEEVQKIQKQFPEVLIITNVEVAAALAEEGIVAYALEDGQKKEVKGVSIEAIGSQHAIIHDVVPCVNVGYMIGGTFFYPGDSFTLPERPVQVLALPIAAPWMAVTDAITYINNVMPVHAFPVHDAVLSDVGRMSHEKHIINNKPSDTVFHGIENGAEYTF